MQTAIQEKIESVINNIDRLPSIPGVASQIISLVNNPDASFNKIAEVIAKDQSMTTNILKLCNSAYFNRGKEISSLERAVVTLGMKEVKDIVVIVSTKAVMNKAVLGYDLEQGEMWKHGLAVAILSKRISLMKGKKSIADIAFTGGIIHDVGKTVLALFVQKTFKDIFNLVETNEIPFHQAEKIIMGFDHQEIGEKILTKWKFPNILKDIVKYHHQPEDAPDNSKLLVSIIHIANIICLMAGIGIGSDGLYHELNDTALEIAGIKNSELEKLYSNLPVIIEQVNDIQ
ncbi:MAG: HDOD domain-containing protein [Spirochaetota bacterium]|nr:HDOD domain-containing protein [Spirochaetota bacterium]